MRCIRSLSRFMCHVVAMLLSLFAIRAADAQAIWLVPPGLPHGGLSDFMTLFRPDAPWQQAASHVQAFEVISAMVNQGADHDLAQILGDLRRRNIALVVSIGPLAGAGVGPGHCGFHVEGYSAAGESMAEAMRIAKLGGVAQYFSMDEPLYYGHTFNGQNACHSSIAQIAKDIAVKVRQIHTIFPQARFGDVEPVPIPRMPLDTWLADLATWFDAFQAETGQPLAFLRLDVFWRGPWQPLIPPLVQLLKRKGIALQIIYDGYPNDASDAQAVASSITNFKMYESDGRSPPDAAVFQWWTKYPSHILPETDPGSGMYMVDQYVQWRQSHH